MTTPLFSSKEMTVLTALFASGNATIAELSTATLINRTSLYPIIKKLQQKGLVSSVRTEGKQYIQSLPKEEVKEWVKRQKKLFTLASDEAIEWVDNHTDTATLATETKYYQGIEGVKALYHDSWRDNTDKEILALTDYAKAYETMGDFFDEDYFKKRIEKNIHVKSLLAPSPAGKKDMSRAKELLREVRFIKLFEDLGIELNIYGDKITLVSFDKTMPTGILIKNKVIARAFKEIFHYLWDSAKKPTNKKQS